MPPSQSFILRLKVQTVNLPERNLTILHYLKKGDLSFTFSTRLYQTKERLSFASQEMADLWVKKFGVIQVYPILSPKVFGQILHYELDSTTLHTHYKKFQPNR